MVWVYQVYRCHRCIIKRLRLASQAFSFVCILHSVEGLYLVYYEQGSPRWI